MIFPPVQASIFARDWSAVVMDLLRSPRWHLFCAKIVQTERYELAQMPEEPPILCKDTTFAGNSNTAKSVIESFLYKKVTSEWAR